MSKIWFYSLLLALLLVGACANIVPPDGGDRDVKGPRLLAIKPADSSLNSKPRNIELTFDEFITVADAASQLQISPLLPYAPIVTVKARKVKISIPDTLLQDATTYTISFGNMIKDIHEGNAFEGFTYLFSTGSYFDSLSLSGVVIDAATGKADTAAKVFLYPFERDRKAVYNSKPLYVTTTGGDGKYSFKGLPDKAFRIFALRDANNNLQYDAQNEAIAFDDIAHYPSKENSVAPLYIFAEVPDSSSNIQKPGPATGKPKINAEKNVEAKAEAKDFTYRLSVDTNDISKRTQELMEPIEMQFTRDVDSMTTARMSLTSERQGILVEMPFQSKVDSANRKIIRLQSKWLSNTIYTLRLFKGFAKDSSGTEAFPSKYIFLTKAEEDYAKMQVAVPSSYTNGAYILQVATDGKFVYQQVVKDSLTTIPLLKPGKYNLSVIDDKNRNGKWDTGSFDKALQPEKVYPFVGEETLRAG